MSYLDNYTLENQYVPLKRDDFNAQYIFQPQIFSKHLSFPGSISNLSIFQQKKQNLSTNAPRSRAEAIVLGSASFGRSHSFFAKRLKASKPGKGKVLFSAKEHQFYEVSNSMKQKQQQQQQSYPTIQAIERQSATPTFQLHIPTLRKLPLAFPISTWSY